MSNSKQFKIYNYIIRGAIVITSLAFLYHQLFIKQDINNLYDEILLIFKSDSFPFFILLCLALMPLNWTLESLKWRFLLKGQESISIATALKAVFSGATISAVSPNRTGDYLGRVFILQETSFWKGVFITLIGSFAQTITTLLVGGVAFFTVFSPKMIDYEYLNSQQNQLLAFIFFGMLTLSMLFYFRISILAQIIPKHWVKTHRYVDVFRTYNWSQLLVTLIISILRYAVFSFQFYILLLAVGMVDLSLFSGLSIISSIFLLNTIRPSIALLEIGIRGSVALFIFGLYFGFDNGHEEAIFTASTLIWLINIIIPALIGLIFIKDLRFFKSKRA